MTLMVVGMWKMVESLVYLSAMDDPEDSRTRKTVPSSAYLQVLWLILMIVGLWITFEPLVYLETVQDGDWNRAGI